MERVISDIITKTFDTMDEIFTSFVVMNKYAGRKNCRRVFKVKTW